MSEYFDLPDSDGNTNDEHSQDEHNEEVSEFVPDPSTVAFLDQEAAAFAEIADEFEATYGFRHDCHCDSDYAEGKVGEVTECYAGMIVEALAACAKFNYENKQLRLMLQQLIDMNNGLMDAAVGEAGEDEVIQAEIEQLREDEADKLDNNG